jgi:hypothetical protein
MNSRFRIALLLGVISLSSFADEAGGLQYQPPKAWKLSPPKPMRAATFLVDAVKPDAEGAELAVFYFGEGQGGAVQPNIERWATQFEGAPKAVTRSEKIAGFAVTHVEIDGTYLGSMGQGATKPGFKLAGAIVEGPKGAVFYKMTGPKKTVDSAKKELMKMLKSLKAS